VQQNSCIQAFVTIEASHIVESDDSDDIRGMLDNMVVNMECCSTATRGVRLAYRKKRLGCLSLSLGVPPGVSEVVNVAVAAHLAIDPVFTYLTMSRERSTAAAAGGGVSATPLSEAFASYMMTHCSLDVRASVQTTNPNAEAMGDDGSPRASPSSPTAAAAQAEATKAQKHTSVFGRLMGAIGGSSSSTKSPSGSSGGKGSEPYREDGSLAVTDFDLLKIVGKGAFGKVMLVRKRAGFCQGEIYAMKVLKKSVVADKGQIEHTKSEQSILCEIRHPYIVRLRFSFQSEDKLYLVTDYYIGGTLFYHLKKSKQFTMERARFYAAELLSALDHLHQKGIIYRDLKLENVLMDDKGHIALTDFGLSKQNIDASGGATTFCGTAEYIAPELLKGQKYGKAVDWWSFGILLYEMMFGRTPFYDKNRKLMFYRIMNTDPTFPPQFFSDEASDCIKGLLRVNENLRLGSGEASAREIMETPFFSAIDFNALMDKMIEPPFSPEVTDVMDTKYVPKAYSQMDPARDSVTEPVKKGTKQIVFEDFSFGGDQTMGNR